MATNVTFRNPSVTNSVKVTLQDAVMVEDKKDPAKPDATPQKRHNGQWKSVPTYSIVKPNEHGALWLGPGRRAIIEELPT